MRFSLGFGAYLCDKLHSGLRFILLHALPWGAGRCEPHPPHSCRAEAEAARTAAEQELAEAKSAAEEEQQALQGKLSQLTEQLLNSMIEPVKRGD